MFSYYFKKKKKKLYPYYFLVINIYEYMTLEFEFTKQIKYKFLNPKGMQVFLNAPEQPRKAHNKSITGLQASEYDKNNEYEL